MMHPELVAALRGKGPASKIHEHCDYLASRGASGLGALKAVVARARRDDGWAARIPCHGAVQNGHVDVLRYLLDDVGVTSASLAALDKAGNTALHHAVIWGRPSCAALLLARGADACARNAPGGATPVKLSRSTFTHWG